MYVHMMQKEGTPKEAAQEMTFFFLPVSIALGRVLRDTHRQTPSLCILYPCDEAIQLLDIKTR